MGIKQNVLDALRSEPVKWVNFTFGNHMISPITYYLVATCIANDRIICKTDANFTDRAEYDSVDDTITAEHHRFGRTPLEKSVLIHECTHAILDCLYAGKNMNGRTESMKNLTDETIGYLAGAIYLLAAGQSVVPTPNDVNYEAENVVGPKFQAVQAKATNSSGAILWSGCETMAFTALDVGPLQKAIIADPFYSNDYKLLSTHNGMKRIGLNPGFAYQTNPCRRRRNCVPKAMFH